MPAMIEISGLTKDVVAAGRRLTILHDIDLSVPRGQFLAIMGPSGSGKSTLLGLIAGLDRPTAGRVVIDGEEIGNLPEDRLAQLRARKLGFVFQAFHLIPTLTALENVALPLELAGHRDALALAADLLADVGLAGRRQHYPAQLSGGEQQRVALARACAVRPPILLADEPTGNLDSESGQQVLAIMERLHHQQQTTLVLVTHDGDLAAMADRVIRMRDGAVAGEEVRAARV